MSVKLKSVFHQWHVPLSNGSWIPRPGTDDFGQKVDIFLLSGETDEKLLSIIKSEAVRKKIWEGISFVHTPQNLKMLEAELGITFKQVDTFYYIRDFFIRLRNGKIGTPYESNELDLAVERVHSSNLYLDKTSTTRTLNQLFNHWSGVGRKYASQSSRDVDLYFPQVRSSFNYSYVEGGNVFTLTNQQEEICVLVGEDHRMQTFLLLEFEGRDWTLLAQRSGLNESFDALTSKIAGNLTEEEVFLACEELYSLGLLRCQGETGLISSANQLNILLARFFMGSLQDKTIAPEELGWFRSLAARGGFIKTFQIGEDKWEAARQSAAQFRAKLEIVHTLMAQDFQVSPKNLYFISQANYHLDAFLTPGPQHSIFLINYAFCADIVEEIMNNRETLGISLSDLELLENYHASAKKFHLELGGFLSTIEKQLKNAGFTVIPTPGHFIFEPKEMYEQFPIPSDGLCINFINAINGWSAKRDSYYYITHGLHAGDQVGTLLMKAFSDFLESYVPGIKVAFVGYDPGNPEDFSEGLDFWNRLETQTGVHCATFPLR